ncbi:MAG: hypothetical protein J6E38_04830 [Clostridia bacterium]|nr:hypothetical protein [Clostridia bacterium]
MRKFLSVLLALMMVVSTVSFAAPAVVTVADSATDANVAYEATETTTEVLELFADDTWYDKTKGTLLFNMDFDEDNSGNAVAASAYDGISLGSYSAGAGELVSELGRLNPDVAGNYDVGFRYTTSGSAAIGDDNGNKYLSLNSSGSNQISLYLGNTYTKTGTYVFEYKYKLVSTGATTAKNITYNTLTPVEGGTDAYTFDTWVTETATFEVTSIPSYSRIIFYGAGNYSTSDKLYLDDIKVWYYDTTADYDTLVGQKYVTVYSGRDDLENQVIPVPAGTTVTMQQVMGMVSAELPGCIGFAETADGEILPLDTVITIDSNKTFYAVWSFDASVSANGNENVTDLTVSGIDSRRGITVAELISKIDVSSSTRALLGLSTSADGDVLATSTVITSDDTLYMIWGAESLANKWTDAEMGTRIFFIDLDGDTNYLTADLSKLKERIDGTNDNNSAKGLYVEEIGRFNPSISGYESVMKYSFKDGGTPTVEGTDDKYFKHTTSTRSSVMVANPFVGDGAYTLVFNHNADTNFTIHSGYTGGSVTSTAVDSTFTQTAYTVNIANQGGNDYFRMYASSAPGTYYIDDIALYFKPSGNLTLTVENVNESKTYSVAPGTYTASELVNLVKDDIPTCVGFSKTQDGEVFSGDETIDVLVNTTLYAVAGFDVTLKANDNEEFADINLTGFNSKEGVTVEELLSKIENDTDRLVRGLSETADGALLSKDTVIKEAKTLYIMWTVDETKLGTLIFNIDFEKDGIEAPENGSSTSINTLTDIFNSDLVPDGIKLSLDRLNETSLVSENGNTYFASSNKLDDRCKININEFETGFEWTYGTYTLVADVKMGASANASYDNMTAVDSFANEEGKWDRVTYELNRAVSNTANDSGELYGSVTFGFAAAAGTTIALDNIKLYFKTDETTITVRNGGNMEITDTVVNVDTTDGITVAKLIEEVNKQSTSRTLLGIAKTPTGKLLDTAEVIVPKYPIYLYAKWQGIGDNPYVDNYLGHMLAFVDFERQDVVDANWNGYAELDNTANPGAGDRFINVATYTHDLIKDRNARFLVRINTGVTAENDLVGIKVDAENDNNHYIEGTTSAETYPKVQFINNENEKLVLRDGIYTMYVDAMSTGPNGISYHYAGDNVKLVEGDDNSDGRWDFVRNGWKTYGLSFEVHDGEEIPDPEIYFNHVDAGYTVAFDNFKFYYKPFYATITLEPGEEMSKYFGVHTVENISTTGEHTGNDIVAGIQGCLDLAEKAGVKFAGLMDEYGDMINLDAKLVIPGDMTYTIVWENVDTVAPETWNSNSVRYSINENTKGLRFAANMYKEKIDYMDGTHVTEYGWIVTRPELLEKAGLCPYAFTKDSVLDKPVIVGQNYGYQQTGDEDADRKHLEEDDTHVVITAVVYGLKPANYKNEILMRPYIVVDGVTYYGKPWQRSVYDTACALRDNGYPHCDDETKAYIDQIIADAI